MAIGVSLYYHARVEKWIESLAAWQWLLTLSLTLWAFALSFFYVVRLETPLDPVVGMLADLVLFACVLVYLRRRGREPT